MPRSSLLDRHRPLLGELGRYGLVGLGGTAAYVGGFVALRPVLPSQAASLAARLGLAILTTSVNGRFTFGRRASRPRIVVGGLVGLLPGAVFAALALALLHVAVSDPARGTEVAVLAVANVASALVRFVVLRQWIFRHDRDGTAPARAVLIS